MMTKRAFVLWLLAISLTGAAPRLGAQVFTPTFQPPAGGGNLGVYLSDFHDDLAVEGIFRQGARPFDLGFRIGVADVGDAAFLLGVDLRHPLALGTAPVDFAFTGGVQALLGDVDGYGFQGGLSIGSTFPLGGFAFTPYVHPRIALVNPIEVNPNDGDDDADLGVLADVGFDLAFPSFVLRFGANLANNPGGIHADWGIGVAFR